MALRVAAEKASAASTASPAVTLYRYITKQVPRVLTLYDISMEPSEARLAVQALFREHAEVKDPRIVDMLITKANMELEETLMQWKQKVHLLTLLERAQTLRQPKLVNSVDQSLEKFFAGIDDEEDEL
ncbi:NADH:ubiquinone oxidoreductase, NDUFA6/B14 subunit [Plasmopara halstedii]|uniref:NADH:ubiquinone oxidoreductase, NDUFA6/B14 subunit n=1 Tax=Plasmopara halstedii TaxID=4781 RepID=A0A0P1B7E0_PLAHL|nr:NADH:ubiquinone oxidoreductase, NDUFA6/B14 subunit [Plasmopara halstedii]CEG49754.1 NADH:ubiquinone oxidoreductase, NDUFA6/B14 subunit [Plasmopara halstedii]|eukprot:XP_024586123.1 NADH:ubiquinone oxidoreductase, NDUFA6/B14 subunit [Plasmopara halstedii]